MYQGLRPVIQVDQLRMTYGTGVGRVEALRGVSLRFDPGSFTALMGPSGSGKSTFLNCAAGLERPTSGLIRIGDEELTGSEDDVTRFRRERIGIVFQGLNLLPYLTALQNVELPLRLAGRPGDPSHCRDLLDQVGLVDRAGAFPAQLSGGQQQRVAIARALVAAPDVVFADEPTGALDRRSTRQVLGLLRGSVDRLGQTLVLVTHDPVAAAYADTVRFLADGQVVATMTNPTQDAVAAQLSQLDQLTPAGGAL